MNSAFKLFARTGEGHLRSKKSNVYSHSASSTLLKRELNLRASSVSYSNSKYESKIHSKDMTRDEKRRGDVVNAAVMLSVPLEYLNFR